MTVMSRYIHNTQGWKSPRSRTSHKQLIKNLALLAIALGFAGSLMLVGLMAFISGQLPNPNSLTERSISQTTKIYDRTGEHLLYEIFGSENRTLKKVQEGFCKDDKDLDVDKNGIPLFALQATIAAEDRGFCKHNGFDIKGIVRAFLENLRGNRVGGSTLTQQLVKNAILSNEKTFTRKIKELMLSVELERRYTKDEILQIYFNEIPYGSTYYGIEAASQNLFKKSVNQLTLAEAATLAALPKAPTTYLNNPDRLLARRDYILNEMKNLGFITEEQLASAKKESTPVKVQLINIEAPHFVLYVKEQLEEKFGQQVAEAGGLKVITTLNYDYQKIAEEEVKKHVDEKGPSLKFSNAALVAIDPKNGQILSMVGSKDYFDDTIDGQVNVATRLRQPGSSFKPIVYSKAFEMGYTPNTVVWDVLTDFPTVTGTYTPHNYDLKERGPVRLRDALQLSLNIPAVKMLYMVGVENALDFATSLGYTSFGDHSAFGLSLVLGGGEVKLLEHVNAYAAFANEGKQFEPVSILKIEDASGETLEEWKQKEGKKVLDENIARMITHVLSDNNARAPVFGLNSPLQLGDRPVAAKTGTTNNNRDAWLLGYTPSLVAGVWAGNNNNSEMTKSAGGFSASGPIWNAFMKRALEKSNIETFTPPVIKATGKPILDGKLAASTVIIDKISGKLATEFTPTSQKEERTFAEFHSLLHYVDRSNPIGDPPKDPSSDPYYEQWEIGIKNWITKQEQETGKKITQSAPPTEFDDIHVPENFPSIKILSPQDNQLIGRQINIEATTSALRKISRVEFYTDGAYLGSDETSPYKFNSTLPNTIGRGTHSLKSVVFDDVDNQGSNSVSIQVSEDASEDSLTLIDPKHGQTIERTSEKYTIVVSVKKPDDYSSIRIYVDPSGPEGQQLIGQQSNPNTVFSTFDWTLPQSGIFALFAEGTTKQGAQTQTSGVLITINPPSSNSPTESDLFIPQNDLNLF